MTSFQFRAGAARVDITPEVMCDLSGFLMRDNPATGIHDPIYAQAMAFDDGQRQALLIVSDILGLTPADAWATRQAIEWATGVPASHVMAVATHTHAAPATMPLIHCGSIDPGWFDALRERQVRAAVEALGSLAPARMFSGRVVTPPVNANRRDPQDAVDRDLDLLRIDGVAGPIAAFMAYGCHPVAAGHGNRLVSADYFGVLRAECERATGALVVATSGACGDVNPAIGGNPFIERPLDLSLMRHVGMALAEAALVEWANLTPVTEPAIHATSVALDLPYQPLPTAADLTRLADGWRAGGQAPTDPAWVEREAGAMLEWVARTEARLQVGLLRPTTACELQMLQLGDVVLIGAPGELFAALGLAIKAGAPQRHPIVLGYANGNIGYIPTRTAYSLGGYEIASAFRFYDHPAAVAPEAGEMMVAAALRALRGG